MAKRKRRRSVGANNSNVSQAVMDTAVTGAEVIGGFMAAEAVANAIGSAVPSINTPLYRTGVKAFGAIATAAFAMSKSGRSNRKDLLTIAGGMGANAIATAAKSYLPASFGNLLPTVAGYSSLPGASYQSRVRGYAGTPQKVKVQAA